MPKNYIEQYHGGADMLKLQGSHKKKPDFNEKGPGN